MHQLRLLTTGAVLFMFFLAAVPCIGMAEIPPLTPVAVMEFTVDGADLTSGQGRVVGELLMGELLDQGKYRIVERLQLEKATAEMGLQGGGDVDPSTAVAIGRRVGAQVVIVGTLSALGGERLLLGRFVDVEKGTVLLAKTVPFASAAMLPAVQTLARAFATAEEEAAGSALTTAHRRAELGQTRGARELYEWIATRYPRSKVGDDALLELAKQDREAGDLFAAADRAEDLLETFPQSPLAEDALFVLAESKYFTVFDDPTQPRDPARFLKEWNRLHAGEGEMTALDQARLRQRIAQEAKQKYELLLELFPGTKYADMVKERLARIDANGGN